jgi:hypothetical protein
LEIERIKEQFPKKKKTDTGELKRISKLHDAIAESFNILELQSLIFDLGLNSENHEPYGNIHDKALSVVLFMSRYGRMEDLITALSQARPHIKWDEIK